MNLFSEVSFKVHFHVPIKLKKWKAKSARGKLVKVILNFFML